jgi:DNA-binding NarL/FixJ family response regulator
MPVEGPTRIVVVQDDPASTDDLQRLLSSSSTFTIARSIPSDAAALETIRHNPPDLVLVDFRHCTAPIVECLHRLRSSLPALPVVVFNVEAEPDILYELLRAGAAGILDSQRSPSQILRAVQFVLEGGVAFSPRLSHMLVPVAVQWEGVTRRQEEIIERLLAGRREKETAEELGIRETTVHTHLRRLFHKYGVHSWREFVRKRLSAPRNRP